MFELSDSLGSQISVVAKDTFFGTSNFIFLILGLVLAFFIIGILITWFK